MPWQCLFPCTDWGGSLELLPGCRTQQGVPWLGGSPSPRPLRQTDRLAGGREGDYFMTMPSSLTATYNTLLVFYSLFERHLPTAVSAPYIVKLLEGVLKDAYIAAAIHP